MANQLVTKVRNEISSINVVEPLPRLIITLSKRDAGGPTILVDGMTTTTAMEIPWSKIFDLVSDGLGKLFDGGGGDGCTTIKITNPDGSSTEIKTCPAPKA